MDKIRCRLCEKEYEDKEMSDEHYPAHSVGNDDIVHFYFTINNMRCMRKAHLYPINIIDMMELMIISFCWTCSIKEIRARLQSHSIEK